MTDLSLQLDGLGAELERVARADLRANPPRRTRSRRLGLTAALAGLLIPGVAIATVAISDRSVALSLPAGTLALVGTDPTCTTITAGVEYHCVTARAPKHEVQDWRGATEPTVDATKHVNGGCLSLASDGRIWQCYIGRSAVTHHVIGASYLGWYAPTPTVG
jgi:hypothetical protein